MIRVERDVLHYLGREDPEFSLYYQTFLEIDSRSSKLSHLALCGPLAAEKSGLLAHIQQAFAARNVTPAGDKLAFFSTDAYHFSVTAECDIAPERAIKNAISADWIIYALGSTDAPLLTDNETRFLTSLHQRFPDLDQRMIFVMYDDEIQRLSPSERFRLQQNLWQASRQTPPLVALTALGDKKEFNAGSYGIGELQKQVENRAALYPGGLAGARRHAARTLLDGLAHSIAMAIKKRENAISAIEDDMAHSLTLWRQDLQLLDELLRLRIMHHLAVK